MYKKAEANHDANSHSEAMPQEHRPLHKAKRKLNLTTKDLKHTWNNFADI